MSSDSSNKFCQEKYDALKKTFDNVKKKIFNYHKRELPTDVEERTERINLYKVELVSAYNDFVEYIETFFLTFDTKSKASVREKVSSFKQDILRAVTILDLFVDLPNDFEQINLESVIDLKDAQHRQTEDDVRTNIFVRANTPTISGNSDAHGDSAQGETQAAPADNRGAAKFPSTEISKESQGQFESNSENTGHSAEKSQEIPGEVLNGQESLDSFGIDKNDTGHLPGNSHENLSAGRMGETPNTIMALSVSDILNGIKEFSSQNQDEIRQFIANVDMIHSLAINQRDAVMAVVRARLTNAHKLGDISEKQWAEIKPLILEKYRTQVSFETAQERLLSIRQGPKETIETYADRVKKLLDTLNGATTSTQAAVQAANRAMNESLAVRKFKQNIFDEKIRIMALSAEHTSLYEAVSHAAQKREQLNSSNIVVGKEPNGRPAKTNNNNTNGNKNNNNNGNNNGPNKKREPCSHCNKNNHSSDRCFLKDKEQGPSRNDANKQEKFANRANRKNANSAATARQAESDEDDEPEMASNSFSLHDGKLQVRPYHLNY